MFIVLGKRTTNTHNNIYKLQMLYVNLKPLFKLGINIEYRWHKSVSNLMTHIQVGKIGIQVKLSTWPRNLGSVN